jgi:hypothetical protein
MKTIVTTIIAAALLAGCAFMPDKISGQTLGLNITNSTVVTDLQSAAYNLDSAVLVGALAPDDPAPACLHAVLVKAGIEIPAGTTAPKSFQPKYDGAASAGAVAYILAQQAKNAKSVAKVDPSCEALVGRVVIDGVKAAKGAAVSIVTGLLH